MDVRFGAFTLRVDCPACGLPVPLNAPAETAHCSACTRDFPVPARVFAYLLMHFDDERAAGTPYPEGAQPVLDGMQVHATSADKEPCCEKCGAALALDTLPLDATTTLTCACGAEAVGFPAPAWLRERAETARYVVVTDATAAPGTNGEAKGPAPEASRPVALPCTQCGAPLHVTSESERTVPCEFCKTDVYLPDDLWRRLHPVKTMATWFVRFEGESRASLAAAQEAEARLDALVKAKAEGVKARRGCLNFFLALAAIVVLIFVVARLMAKPAAPVVARGPTQQQRAAPPARTEAPPPPPNPDDLEVQALEQAGALKEAAELRALLARDASTRPSAPAPKAR